MWLILCEADDLTAGWVSLRLKERGHSVETVVAEELVYGAEWSFTLSGEGSGSRLRLARCITIDSHQVQAVLNRLTRIPDDYAGTLPQRDREYVHEEYHAFLTSWLFSFQCPVLNPPGEYSLSGDARDPSEWVWLALQSGLPAAFPIPEHDSDAVSACVIGDEVLSESLPPELHDPCRRLSLATGLPALGLRFVRDSGTLRFYSATPAPDYRALGLPAIDALERMAVIPQEEPA